MIGVLSQRTIRGVVLLLVCSVSSGDLHNLSEPESFPVRIRVKTPLDLITVLTF